MPLGPKLVLAGAVAFFGSLFLTWQKIELDYGSAGTVTSSLDAFDAWGVLLVLLSLAIIVLTVLVWLTDVELSETVRWDRITLTLAIPLLLVTLVKNLLDSGSTITSYVGIGLAAVVVAGAVLSLEREQAPRTSPSIPQPR